MIVQQKGHFWPGFSCALGRKMRRWHCERKPNQEIGHCLRSPEVVKEEPGVELVRPLQRDKRWAEGHAKKHGLTAFQVQDFRMGFCGDSFLNCFIRIFWIGNFTES
jgi:hypothetical protein